MLVTIKPVGGGVVKDLPPNELSPNQWSDAVNMRFGNGIAERRGGLREGAGWTAPSAQPYALSTFLTTAGARFIVRAGIAKVHADNGSSATEITRFTDGVTISNMTAVGATVTVTTATNHGLSNGNPINVYGALEAAYNVTNKTITVTGATTFTYTADSAPGASPATTFGYYELRVTNDFTGGVDDRWCIFNFGGSLIFNNPVNGMFYWTGDTTVRLRPVRNLGTITKFYAAFALKDYIVGLRPTDAGVEKPYIVMWGSSAEPGTLPTTWTAAATNDAGDTPHSAETAGFIIDGCKLGEMGVIFKQDSIFVLEFVGANDVFAMRRIVGTDGLLARGCAVETPAGVMFLSNGDLRLFNGQGSVSVIEGINRRWLNSQMDGTYGARSFVVTNPVRSEVWACFPSYGNSTPNKVLVWTWKRTDPDQPNPQSIFEIPACTCGTTGLIASGVDSEAWSSDSESWLSDTGAWYSYLYGPNEQRLILATGTSKLALADTGSFDLSSAISWRLEKTGTTLGNNDSVKVISRSRPQVATQAGTVFSVTHATTMQASDTVDYPTSVTYTAGTSEWANRFSKAGRFMAVKYEGSDVPAVAIRSYDVEFSGNGRF